MTKNQIIGMWMIVFAAMGMAVVLGSTNLPPTPPEMGLEPPEVPEWPPVRTVYVIPSNTVIRFQTRETMTSNAWEDVTIIKTKKQTGFYRIIIEGE